MIQFQIYFRLIPKIMEIQAQTIMYVPMFLHSCCVAAALLIKSHYTVLVFFYSQHLTHLSSFKSNGYPIFSYIYRSSI